MINSSNRSGFYGSPYPFGVDPIWQLAENKIVFLIILHNDAILAVMIIIGNFEMSFSDNYET
jgi:hypothetical protein